HEVTVTLLDARANEVSETLRFTAPPLPEVAGEFPPIRPTVSEPHRMEPGYTLFSSHRLDTRRRLAGADPTFPQDFGMLVLLDSAGTPVWYYLGDSRVSDFEQLANGNLLLITQDFRLVEIDWLGNTQRTWVAARRPQGPAADAIGVDALTFHHDVEELPNGNLMVLGSEIREIDDYYTSETDPDAPRRRQRVVGDVILEIERDTGSVVWSWHAFDHLDPFRIGYESFSGYWERRGFPNTVDWSHANTLLHDPTDDSLIVNFRYQSAAIKIDRRTSEILWIFGEPSGWGELSGLTFRLAADASWPYHQHSPHPTPNGTLLIFDNANFQAHPFAAPTPPRETTSRAVEFLIDRKIMTAGEVWSSQIPGEESVVSLAMGDVDWLSSTGNVLVAYGAIVDRDRVDDLDWNDTRGVNRWTRLREYTRDTPPKLVWEIVIKDTSETNPLGWTLFAAERISMPRP
ncbi:MAG: aryl-sulfate sulfotransferase, partial [Acidobacteriota bacterium]|nr:aryl-sulfate sulfotransferase [Acidobacteriota bacterium]